MTTETIDYRPAPYRVSDDKDIILGLDGDIRIRLRATAIAADAGDTDLPALFKGTSDHQAIANNTLILSNITSDGDVLMLVNDGGISKEFLHVDGSAAVLTLGHGMVSVTIPTDLVVKTGKQILLYDADNSNYVGFVAPALAANKVWTLPTTDGTNGQVLTTNGSGVLAWSAGGASASWGDDALLNLGTGNDIAFVLRSTSLNANTALAGVLIGTPVTQALAANSLIVANQTADGDLLLAINDGGTSKSVLSVVGATAIGTLGHGLVRFDLTPPIAGLSTTDATSTTAAALKTAGGLAVAKKAYITGPVFIGTTTNRQTTLQKNVASIADNTATTILTFSVPNPDTSATYSSVAGVWVTFTFHTFIDVSNYMTSMVSFYVSMLRNYNANTVSQIDFLSTVKSSETGTAGTHTALAAGQFTFAITGAADADQTVTLQFTNDYDASISVARVNMSCFMDVMTNVAVEIITMS